MKEKEFKMNIFRKEFERNRQAGSKRKQSQKI